MPAASFFRTIAQTSSKMPGGTFNPRCMWNDREVNWREEIGSKTTVLCIIPSKTGLMFQHEIVHEGAFLRREEFSRMVLVESIASFNRIMVCGLKQRRIGIE